MDVKVVSTCFIFSCATKALHDGQKVTNLNWKSRSKTGNLLYITREGANIIAPYEHFEIYSDDSVREYIFTTEDILSDNWCVVDIFNENKLNDAVKERFNNIFFFYVMNMIMSRIYNWDAEYSLKCADDTYETFVEKMKELNIDFTSLGDDDYNFLGFLNSNGHWLVPLYLVDIIPGDVEVTTLSGEKQTMNTVDKDNKNGYICCYIK